MKSLATNQKVLTWLCICPFDRDTSNWKKSFFAILTFFLFALEFTASIAGIVFVVNNVSIDLESSLFAVYHIAAHCGLSYMFFVAFILRKGINRFLGTLEAIFEERKLNRIENAPDFEHRNSMIEYFN